VEGTVEGNVRVAAVRRFLEVTGGRTGIPARRAETA
jgi:hypothetical protein